MKIWTSIILMFSLITIANAQKNDQNWVLGIGTGGKKFPDSGVFFMNFDYNGGYKWDIPDSDSNGVVATYAFGTTSYSDKEGNLKFISNGIRIFNSTLEVMENGDTINPGYIWNKTSKQYNGYPATHNVLGLPAPGQEDDFAYMVHYGVDTCKNCYPLPNYFASPMYYSKLDLQANGGLGKVVEKNVIMAEGRFLPYSATRHANGRDWWLVVPEENKNIYCRWLLTPEGFKGPWKQQIGPIPNDNKSQYLLFSCFSPQGDRFAAGWQSKEMVVFDFDRCTGLLDSPRTLSLNEPGYEVWNIYRGCLCFSSSGRFCYINCGNRVFQVDLEESNLSLDTIGTCQECNDCEGSIGQSIPGGDGYEANMQLAPDGNIYFSQFQPHKCIFRIANSDKKYPDNDVKVEQVSTPFLQAVGMPFYINYRLGALAGSPCDTLTSTSNQSDKGYGLKLYPNPAKGDISIDITLPRYNLQHSATLMIFDLLGREVYSHEFSQYSYMHTIASGSLVPGLYFASLYYRGQVVKTVEFGVVE
ncbi:MAG: T9SS type A sorting domain-containing protein [Saprospiraceae bacterium]|nr:T9SS type A sorting domain-containing protein [Saprospiraceae bacterium]